MSIFKGTIEDNLVLICRDLLCVKDCLYLIKGFVDGNKSGFSKINSEDIDLCITDHEEIFGYYLEENYIKSTEKLRISK